MSLAHIGAIFSLVVALISIIGAIVKVSMDYAKIKQKVETNEKQQITAISDLKNDFARETKDIREDFQKDIKNLSDINRQERSGISQDIKNLDTKFATELTRLKDQIAEDKKYTHESFVKITSEQKEMADTLKEVSMVLKSFENNIGRRLESLEVKIDTITTLKVVE